MLSTSLNTHRNVDGKVFLTIYLLLYLTNENMHNMMKTFNSPVDSKHTFHKHNFLTRCRLSRSCYQVCIDHHWPAWNRHIGTVHRNDQAGSNIFHTEMCRYHYN